MSFLQGEEGDIQNFVSAFVNPVYYNLNIGEKVDQTFLMGQIFFGNNQHHRKVLRNLLWLRSPPVAVFWSQTGWASGK